MTMGKLFANGQELRIDKRIGKGGEGEVFNITNLPGFAVKAYLPSLARDREAKIKAMVGARFADATQTVAFPYQVVLDARGEFAGFIMRLVEKHKEIHELQTPASRQQHFPKANYPFLVRVALNIAKIFAQVHSTGCVVGDVNQRGILVSMDATVALIDADSFQVTDGGRRYPCVVGVPEYTPPELQGQSLKSVVRTADHDAFGLAVCMFQLLCMDRHPFSGRFSGRGDMPLEKAITEYRFAYSATRNTGMAPPPGSVRLQDFTPKVAQLFEFAFSPQHAGKRPSPTEWMSALAELESSLRGCARNKLHHYARTASECPWCRMEQSGRPLFIDTEVSQISIAAGKVDQNSGLVLDLGALLAAINALPLPTSISVALPPPVTSLQPGPKAQAEKSKQALAPMWKLLGAGAMIGAAYLMFAGGLPPIFALAGIAFGIWLFARGSGGGDSLTAAHRAVQSALRSKVETLQQNSPIERALGKKAEILRAVEDFKALSGSFGTLRADYDKHRKQKQLEAFLSSHSLRGAHIGKVTSSDIAALASYGITSAFEAKRLDVQQVYGIGPVKASNIAHWVSRIESRFQFQSGYTQEDQNNIHKLQNEIISRQQGIEDRLKKLVDEFRTEVRDFDVWKKRPDNQLIQLSRELDQIEVDLKFAGLPVPPRQSIPPHPVQIVSARGSSARPNTFTPNFGTAAKPVQPTGSNNHAPNCPTCSSAMVRRVAKRGARRGSYFWGCSRYPRCTGTRPI